MGQRGAGEGTLLMAGEWVEGRMSRLKTWAQMSGFPSHPAKQTPGHLEQALYGGRRVVRVHTLKGLCDNIPTGSQARTLTLFTPILTMPPSCLSILTQTDLQISHCFHIYPF